MEHAAADEVTALASEADILMWRTAAGTLVHFFRHIQRPEFLGRDEMQRQNDFTRMAVGGERCRQEAKGYRKKA